MTLDHSEDSVNKPDQAAENAVAILVIGLIIVVLVAGIFALILYSKMNRNF